MYGVTNPVCYLCHTYVLPYLGSVIIAPNVISEMLTEYTSHVLV